MRDVTEPLCILYFLPHLPKVWLLLKVHYVVLGKKRKIEEKNLLLF